MNEWMNYHSISIWRPFDVESKSNRNVATTLKVKSDRRAVYHFRFFDVQLHSPTLEARWHWQAASRVMSPFIIFAVFAVLYRRYKLYIHYSFFLHLLLYCLCISNDVCGLPVSSACAAVVRAFVFTVAYRPFRALLLWLGDQWCAFLACHFSYCLLNTTSKCVAPVLVDLPGLFGPWPAPCITERSCQLWILNEHDLQPACADRKSIFSMRSVAFLHRCDQPARCQHWLRLSATRQRNIIDVRRAAGDRWDVVRDVVRAVWAVCINITEMRLSVSLTRCWCSAAAASDKCRRRMPFIRSVWHKVCVRLFPFWKISTPKSANLLAPPTNELRNV